MTVEERRAKKRIAKRKWYWKHVDYARRVQREWHRAHYVPHPRKRRVYSDAEIADRTAMKNSKRHTDSKKAYNAKWYQSHKEYFAAKKREYAQRDRLLMARSPELYAMKREADRLKHRRIRDKFRKRPYKPLLSRRISDDSVFCANCLDRRSVFLHNNLCENKVKACHDFIRMKFVDAHTDRFGELCK